MPNRRILYATDYSPPSQHALSCATWLAQCTGAQLLIVHVSNQEQYPVGELFDEEPEPNPVEMKRLRSVLPTDPGVNYEHRLLYGEPGGAEIPKPADVIVKFAEQEKPEMIVVGTHGRSGLGHLVMGSVAEQIVRRASCPVVTVR